MLPDEDAGLLAAARAIAAGQAVDWAALESSGQNKESFAVVLRELRVVAEIAELHRGLPDPGSSDDDASGSLNATVAVATPEAATWGSLTLLERVGQGAFGDVYRAWDPRLDREVALKLLRRHDRGRDSVGSHVIDEGRLLARVRHPNVVTVHGADRIDGGVGLWMEFVRGRTLEAVLRDHGPFGAQEATLIGLDLCRALSAVHGAGLIHRDVKAQNVMREDGGRIVLMDFGTGRETLVDGQADLAGTPLYMAPEVFSGAVATARGDIYSVGVLLFHLVTGSYPVTGRTTAELREAHVQGRRVWMRDARADLPDKFVQAVERALDVDPLARYESAGAMEAALTRVLAATDTAATHSTSEAIAATPIQTPPSPLSSRPRIWARPVALAAVGLIAVMAVAATVAWRLGREPSAHDVAFQPRDWVLIANFDNATGDNELDRVVTYALERELANSTHVNIVPRPRVEDALMLMKKPVDSALNEPLAREVAMRDGGIRLLIAGRLEKVGSRYAVTSRVIEPTQGVALAVASEYAERADDLSFAIRRLADRIREAVGEQHSTIAQSAIPLERVTTPSLRALRLYSESFYLGHRSRWSGALELARQAVAEDPEFAAAQIWLAWSLRNNAHPQEVYLPVAEKAMALSPNTTDWERFWILGSYYFLLGDDRRAEGAYLALLQLRPDDYWGVNNLRDIYFRQNRESEALPHVVKAAHLRPNDSRANYNAAYQLSYVARDSARARPYVARVAATAGPERPFELAWARYFEAGVRLQQRDVAGAANEVTETLRGLPNEPAGAHDAMVAKAIRYYLAMGQTRHAQSAVEQFQDRDFHYPFYRAIVAFALDDLDAVRRYVAGVPSNSYVIVTTSLMIRVGLIAPAEARITEALRRRPGPGARAPFDSMLRGDIAAAKGDLTGSIPFLQSAVARKIAGNHARTSWLLAQVWLRRGDKLKAIDALRASWAFDPLHDIDIDGPYGHDWMPNALLLAELYRQNGQRKDAEPIEADLAKLLSLADDDFPLLVRLRKLQSGSK